MQYTAAFLSFLTSGIVSAVIKTCNVKPDPVDTLDQPFTIRLVLKDDLDHGFGLAFRKVDAPGRPHQQAIISELPSASFKLNDGLLIAGNDEDNHGGFGLVAGFPFPMDRSLLPKRMTFTASSLPARVQFQAVYSCNSNGERQRTL